MSSSHSKTQRRCQTCGAPLYLRRDVTESERGKERVDVMLVCRDEACTQPARHLRTEYPQTV